MDFVTLEREVPVLLDPGDGTIIIQNIMKAKHALLYVSTDGVLEEPWFEAKHGERVTITQPFYFMQDEYKTIDIPYVLETTGD